MTKNITEKFICKLYEMSHLNYPDRVKAKAKQCFVDYIAVTTAGSNFYSAINESFIKDNGFDGNYHIIGKNYVTDFRTAIMINAFNAHVLELDDSHRVAMTHLGAPIFSALLGVAELKGKTLDDVLRGAIVGYEVAIRLANAIQPGHKKRGFHVSGTCCTIGCAIGIAAMLNYTKEEMFNTFSAAATSASGLLAVISGKSEQKPYNISNASVAGTNAALYGKNFIGATDILGDSRGFLHALTDDYSVKKIFENGFAIETIYQKLYAACRHCHAPMEAMLNITVNPTEVERIIVKVYDLAIKGHDHTIIESVNSAKQSIPYGVAAACVFKTCGIEAFSDEKINDKLLCDILKKITVIEDPELTMLVPEKRAAKVCVYLKNGTYIEKQVDYPKGEPENPITVSEMEKKYYKLTANNFSVDTSKSLLAFIRKESYKPAKEMYNLISNLQGENNYE